jgi:hypothetical protein
MATTRRPLVGWGIGVLVAGVVLVVVAGIGGYRAVANDVDFFLASSVSSPGTVNLHLTPGQYEVMERVSGAYQGLGPPTEITPDDVTVENTLGGSVPVAASELNFDFSRGSSQYRTSVTFQIADEGNYAITVATPRSRFLVTPEVGSVVRHAAPWMLLLTLGGVAVVAGLVLLIVGLVRGRRSVSATPTAPSAVASTAAPPSTPAAVSVAAVPAVPVPAAPVPAVPVPAATASAVAAAGWYADPGGSGRWRWWDGQNWTDHLS